MMQRVPISLVLCALLALVFFLQSANGENVTAETTFYGAKDNCPPGGDIAYPVIHKEAGGTGTYADPITYAGDVKVTPKGTIIYVFNIQKYFIMEDECQECIQDWNKKQKYHFDLWMGPDIATPGPYLITCEDAMTLSKVNVEINPPNNYQVSSKELFNSTNNACYLPNPEPCTCSGSECNECGNECQIPKTETCVELSALFAVTYDRFLQLNPKLDCSNPIPSGHTVCMGGPCGD